MPAETRKKSINLALQGGGSHGAFTWGVLDRLLDEDAWLHIEGISGTSAGAMNGAAMVQGYCRGGAEGARQALNNFWAGVGKMASFEWPSRSPLDWMLGNWNIDASPLSLMGDAFSRAFSPYQMNPLNLNPFRDLVEAMFDVKAVQDCSAIKLFVSATNVETGHARIFGPKDMSVDALMASACLPFNFQAVVIDGVPYWDGGYVGNPSIFPLIYECESPDVVLVQINPLTRRGTPDTPTEIVNRLNEITFNASLISEMRAIAFVEKLVEDDHLKSQEASRLKKMNMHMISAEEEIQKLGASSKLNASIDFLEFLKKLGQAACSLWLKESAQFIGEKSSLDIPKVFL